MPGSSLYLSAILFVTGAPRQALVKTGLIAWVSGGRVSVLNDMGESITGLCVVDCPVQSDLVAIVQTVQYIVTMAFNRQSNNLHILAGIFSLDILYLEGKSPLLMRNNNVKLGYMLPETIKSSTFWDMGVNSHLNWLLLFSPDEAGESETSKSSACLDVGGNSHLT